MPLFGGKKKDKKKKKKDKKKKKKDKKKKGKEPPPKAPEPPKEEVTPDYRRTSVEEMGKVERQIDYFVDRRTKSGVLDRYREKYGEELEAPEGLDGYHYEYVVEELPEEEGGAVDLDKEIVVDEGEGVGAEAAPAAKKEKKSFWGAKKEKKPKAEAAPKEKPPKVEKIKEPSEPLFDPDRFITPKSVGMCILAGKPLFPVYGLFKYKISREPKPGWIMAFIAVPDIIPFALTWIWRLPARGIYEAVMWSKRSKARREEREAAKKEEEPTTA